MLTVKTKLNKEGIGLIDVFGVQHSVVIRCYNPGHWNSGSEIWAARGSHKSVESKNGYPSGPWVVVHEGPAVPYLRSMTEEEHTDLVKRIARKMEKVKELEEGWAEAAAVAVRFDSK